MTCTEASDIRAPRLSDVAAAARACLAVAPPRRSWLMARMLAEAAAADAHRRATGRVHPRWGDGTLSAAALRRPHLREPPLSDAAFRACLAIALTQIGRRD